MSTRANIPSDIENHPGEDKPTNFKTRIVKAKNIVKKANEDELRAHNTLCAVINDASDNRCIWNIFKF